MADKKRVVAANFAAGVTYLATAELPNSLLIGDAATKLQLSLALPQAEALRDYADRLREELKRLKPAVFCAVYPRLHANWVYKDALQRVLLEAGTMIAAAEESIEFRQVRQEQIAKFIKVPIKNFADSYATKLSLDNKPKYWRHRALAFGAASLVLDEYR